MSKKPKYIALDVESGGVTSGTSLLSLYVTILDSDFNMIDEMDLKIKPDDGIYYVTAEAMAVNGINLIEHDKEAITERQAGSKLYTFLNKNNPGGEVKLLPIGQNVGFDIEFVIEKLIAKGSWEKYVSYRLLDTGVIAQYLKLLGKIPESVSGGLSSLVEFFGVEKREAHIAKNDVLMTVDVLRSMLK